MSRDVVSIWLFQLGGAIVAGLLASRAFAYIPDTVVLFGGSWGVFLQALFTSAMLMLCYSVDFGSSFGSPAAALIGLCYGLSLVIAKAGIVPINPATSLGAAIAGFAKWGLVPSILETLGSVFVPIIGCMLGAVGLRMIPSDRRRRL